MSYTYHGTTDLIALPNRTVQTYPSGLVRVERSFVCRKSQVATYRRTIKVGERMPNDNGAPAIDGLFIFPDPQETTRDDGFVEFRVSAYGRTNTTGQKTAQAPISGILQFSATYRAINASYDPADSFSEPTIESSLRSQIPIDVINVNYKFCVPANQKIQTPADIRQAGGVFLADTEIDIFSQSFSAAEIFPQLNKSVVPSSQTRVSPVFSAFITGFDRINFGKFDEISVSYFLQAGSIEFGSFFDAGAVPASPIIESVVPTFTGAVVQLVMMPFSTGVQVTFGSTTQYISYDNQGIVGVGSPFTLQMGTKSNEFVSMTISGLNNNTNYSLPIASVNQNGASARNTIVFKTKSSASFAG